MKILYTYLVALFVLVAAPLASAQTIKYYSKSGIKEVPASDAYYFTIEEVKTDGSGTRTRYLMEDSTKVQMASFVKMKGEYTKQTTLEGPQLDWHRNGKLAAEYNYSNNKLNGEYKAWHENGQLEYKRHYRNGEAQDTLMAYYDNGSLRRVEVYNAGKMITGQVYDMAGNEEAYVPMLQMPSFPGGEQQLIKWLGSNISYPKTTRKAKAQGLVLVTYIVDEKGSITDAEVIRGIHPDADAEALRLINSMPTWEPGLQEGKPAKVRYTIPIRFSL